MKELTISIAILSVIIFTVPFISCIGKKSVQPDTPKNAIKAVKTIPEEDKARPAFATVSELAAKPSQYFKVLNVKTGQIEQIESFDYICGVVAAEEPASFHTEALKAQAVAAFTYAVYHREYNLSHPGANSQYKGADASTDPKTCKAYISEADAKKQWGTTFERDWKKISDAVRAVENKVIVYNGKPIEAFFFDKSSGMTESSKDVWGEDIPYLQEVSSIGDKVAPGFESTVKLSDDDFKKKVTGKFPDAKFDGDPAKWIANVKRSNAGGVISADVCGKSLTGGDIRVLFGLHSANFKLTYSKKLFTFDVKGYGHGVGMSQYGSDYMAGQGKNYIEILKWYYKGVDLTDYQWKQG